MFHDHSIAKKVKVILEGIEGDTQKEIRDNIIQLYKTNKNHFQIAFLKPNTLTISKHNRIVFDTNKPSIEFDLFAMVESEDGFVFALTESSLLFSLRKEQIILFDKPKPENRSEERRV